MLQRYSDGLHHKYDKNHNLYRKHFKSHPSHTTNREEELNSASGLLRVLRLRKLRKRLDKGQFH